MDPSPSVPPLLNPQPSFLTRVGRALVRKAFTFVIGIGLICLVGYCASDRKDYPGKPEFEAANALITTKGRGVAHGNSDAAKKVAEAFSKNTKSLQAVMFTGGSGFSLAAGGEFVTYCRHNPDAVVLLMHVPELRNYKDAKTREALAQLTWTTANLAAKELTFATKDPTLIVGLRGFGSYGPIWSGKLGGQPEIKTDDLDEKRRLYPFFVPMAAPATVATASPAAK